MKSPVRPVSNDELPALAAMLARAFQDDPVFGWILPDPVDRALRLPRLFRLFLRSDAAAGMCLTVHGDAAALWRRPGQAGEPLGEMLRLACPIWRALGGGLVRGLLVSHAIEAHFPAGPFWYLHVVGCDPARQRQGLGAAVIRAGLERIGADVPVYLETGSEANLPFYDRLGFRVVAQWQVPRGPTLWSLRRG